jgi:hypothetical protein
MGIIGKLKNLGQSNAPMTSGAAKAAEGRSDLAAAASKLNEMRGDNVSISGEAVPTAPGADAIAKTVDAAKAIRIVNSRSEGRTLGDS